MSLITIRFHSANYFPGKHHSTRKEKQMTKNIVWQIYLLALTNSIYDVTLIDLQFIDFDSRQSRN